MASNLKNASSWVGGASGSLDSHDGADLSSGDAAVTITSSIVSFHYLNDSAGASESSPDVILPDSNTGDKWWDLLGARLATVQLTSGTSVNEFSTDGTLAGNSDDAVPTEKAVKTYVDGEISGVSAISNFGGYVSRPKFEYKDTDEIYINPGRYEHNGTSQQIVYWNSQLTFQFGAGGSNGDSSALAASDWFYLYVDDSAVVTLGAALLTASEFVAVTTAPTWSNTKHGWYNGNDRCIAAFRTNSSSQVLSFWHDGGEYFDYDVSMADRAYAAVGTANWENVTATVPSFCSLAEVTIGVISSAASGYSVSTRVDGSSGAGRARSYSVGAQGGRNTFKQMLSSSQVYEIKADASGLNAAMATDGYYFPRGM